MSRRERFQRLLVILLVLSALAAGWSWLRPYQWAVDEAAGCRIVGCQLRQDRSNFWVDLQLKVSDGHELDLEKPLKLVTSGGRELTPADLVLGMPQAENGDEGPRKVWLKFWLEQEDLDGPLELKVNDGALQVRSRVGVPDLGSDRTRYFVTHRW